MRNWFIIPLFLTCLLLAGISMAGSPYHIVTNQLPPLKFEEKGIVRGITVDVLYQIMKDVGDPINVADINSMSWARAFEDAQTIPNTIILSMARTTAREDLFKWVGPVYSIQLGLIGKKQGKFIVESAADASLYTVGALRDTAPAQLLVNQGFPVDKLNYLAKTEQALRMLDQGRIDLFAHTADSSFYMMPLLGIDPSEYKVYYVIRKAIPLYIGFHKDFSDDYIAKLQTAFDSLKLPQNGGESPYDEIVQRYVKDRSFISK